MINSVISLLKVKNPTCFQQSVTLITKFVVWDFFVVGGRGGVIFSYGKVANIFTCASHAIKFLQIQLLSRQHIFSQGCRYKNVLYIYHEAAL